MVAEDGREFYAVSSEFDQRALLSNSWLRENVWPSLPTTEPQQYRDKLPPHGWLDTDHPDVRSRIQIARAVQAFIQATPDVELWAWYGAYDHVVLAQLWGRMIDLPDGVPMWTNDLKQETAQLGDPEVPKQAEGLHNALADARHNKVIAEFLDQQRGDRLQQLNRQIKRLADYLLAEHPDQITDGGAVDVAIKILSDEQPTRYGMWLHDENDPARTGWVTTDGGRVILSTDPDELAGLLGAEVREYPEPISAASWLVGS